MKDLVHSFRMKEIISDDISHLTLERFNKTFERVTKKPGSKYDFIVKGGPALKTALFKLCQAVWNTETQPDRSLLLFSSLKGKEVEVYWIICVTCISKMNFKSFLVI